MTSALIARARWTGGLIGLVLLLTGVACGRAVVATQALDVAAGPLLLGLAGGFVVIAVIVAGPVPCIAGVVALTIYSPVPRLELGGGVDITVADAFFAGLAGWGVLHAAGLCRRGDITSARAPVRSAPVLIFLTYIGLTLLYIASVDQGSLSTSSVSWLRLVQTASLGWFVATFVRTRRDGVTVLGAVALAGTVGVGLALMGGAGGEGPLGVRGGGYLDANTLGLVSGFLLLMAVFPAITPRLEWRVPLAIVGGIGLVQSASVASLVGTAVAVILGLALAVRRRRTLVGARTLRAVTALVLALALAYSVTSLIRPENLPGSKGFFYDSAGQRVILGTAGLEIAAKHPLIGVGWQRSSNPDVIGDPAVTTPLRARFRHARNDFFPDVQPMQVHSTYSQVPAELGLIGLGIFLFMIWSLGNDVRRVTRLHARDSPEWAQVWFLGWALVLGLVWMNDNPIYGGQTETVTLALFVGMIAGLGAKAMTRSVDQRTEPVR